MPYRNLKDLMVAIEERLPNGAPKLSERLPAVPDFLVELPDLPAPAKLLEMAAPPAGAGLKHYVTQVEIMPAAKVASTPAAPPLLRGLPDEAGTPDQQRLWDTTEVIDKFLATKRASGASDAYLAGLKRRLRVFARYFPELPTRPEQIEEYLSRFSRETPTAQDNWKVLSMLYGFANTRHGLPNPILQVAKPKFKPKTPRRLTETEAKALLSVIRTDREQAIVYTFLGLGLRLSEAQRLRFRDIGDDTILVHGKERTEEIPLLPEIRDALLKLSNGRKPDDPVFWGLQGPLSTSSFDHIIRQLFARAGITGRKTSAHTLRHTRGALWAASGGDTASSRRLLRHRTTQMTDLYSQLNFTELRAKEERYNPLRTLAEPDRGLEDTSSVQQYLFVALSGCHHK